MIGPFCYKDLAGICQCGKSTGTKDKLEVAVIANEWLKNVSLLATLIPVN